MLILTVGKIGCTWFLNRIILTPLLKFIAKFNCVVNSRVMEGVKTGTFTKEHRFDIASKFQGKSSLNSTEIGFISSVCKRGN